MRTDELLEQCLEALSSGQELPTEIARYLARHPDQRTQVEDMLFIAQRVTHFPSVELSQQARSGMQDRLAARLGVDPSSFAATVPAAQEEAPGEEYLPYASNVGRKKLRLPISRLALAGMRYLNGEPPRDAASEALVRAVFRDLSPEDIRRYIGERGEDYLYYRQRMPGWEPVLAFIAFVLRGFKRIERLVLASSSTQ